MIRRATIEDAQKLAECAGKFYEHSNCKDVGLFFDLKHTKDFAVGLIESPNGCLILAENDGVLVGFVAGVIAPWMMDRSQFIAQEQAWWINPEHRNGKYAIGLLRAFESWAKDNGATHCIMVHLENDMSPRLERFYGAMKYQRMETNYMRKVV